MRQNLQKIKTNFLFFLELQLLISVVILPILIAWGLPISIMSIAGNLIFAQFLTVFIFVAALLFISDLCGVPNSLIVTALEWITAIWHYLLSFGSPHWLVGFASWLFPISCICAIIACTLYYHKKHPQSHRIVILLLLCSLPPCLHILFQKRFILITIKQGSQNMHIIKLHGKIYAFDCGALGARASSQSWIEYTLASAMVKSLGATHIDMLVLCKSNSRTADAAQILMNHIPTGYCTTLAPAQKLQSSNQTLSKLL